MRITLKHKKYPDIAELSPEVIAVIVDEALKDFLQSEKGKDLCAAFNRNGQKEAVNKEENINE